MQSMTIDSVWNVKKVVHNNSSYQNFIIMILVEEWLSSAKNRATFSLSLHSKGKLVQAFVLKKSEGDAITFGMP